MFKRKIWVSRMSGHFWLSGQHATHTHPNKPKTPAHPAMSPKRYFVLLCSSGIASSIIGTNRFLRSLAVTYSSSQFDLSCQHRKKQTGKKENKDSLSPSSQMRWWAWSTGSVLSPPTYFGRYWVPVESAQSQSKCLTRLDEGSFESLNPHLVLVAKKTSHVWKGTIYPYQYEIITLNSIVGDAISVVWVWLKRTSRIWCSRRVRMSAWSVINLLGWS